MENSLDVIGFNGGLISFFINIFGLWKQQTYLWFYFIFIFMNEYLNQILKLIIREDRPNDYKKMTDINVNAYSGAHVYGMPSGHSQSVFFSATYLWLVIESFPILMIQLFICSLTLYQRWKYKKHSVSQLVVGAFVGILFANVTYYLIKKRVFV
jgi:membrane-associated phospholipid phosphatase